jgi:hypothetical protein
MITPSGVLSTAFCLAVFGVHFYRCLAFTEVPVLKKAILSRYHLGSSPSQKNTLYATALETKKDTGIDLEKAFKDGEKLLEGKSCLNGINLDLMDTNFTLQHDDQFPLAPHLTFQKFLTMQEKRVVVTFRYTDLPYLKPYFLTFASKLKKKHSDIIIEKRKLPVGDSNLQPHFEVLVDGKTVMGSGSSKSREQVLGGRVDVQNTQSVYVSMEQISLAITKARKKRRPTTLYGEGEDEDVELDTPVKRWHRSYVLRNGARKPSNE